VSPGLGLAVWAAESAGYVDACGAPIAPPDDPSEKSHTALIKGDRPIAALIRDPGLGTDPEIIEGMSATALTLLENIRLVEELRASSGRLASAAQSERRLQPSNRTEVDGSGSNYDGGRRKAPDSVSSGAERES
jgi:hypothetical protein